MKRILIITATICMLCLTACEETTFVPDPQFDYEYKQKQFSTLAGQFDYIWTGLNNSYLFWDVDTTDWDAVRDEYLPKFQELDELGKKGEDVTPRMIELISKVDSMLLDRHSIIWMTNPYATNYQVYQTSKINMIYDWSEKIILFSGSCFAEVNLQNNHEISDKKRTCFISGFSKIAYSCVIDNSIPILHIGNYHMTDDGFIKENPEFLEVVNNFFDNVRTLSLQGSLKGIVIDNRFNTGGAFTDLTELVQTFSDKQIVPFRQKSKVGLGKFDYSAWHPYIIEPDSKKFIDIHNVPIVVLQNKFSISAGELVGHALSFMPNTYVIGEKSYGALSPVNTNTDYVFSMFHSGSFNTDSIESYKAEKRLFAAVQTALVCAEQKNKTTGEYEQLEGIGFEPDEYVELNISDFEAGTGDNQLEAALNYIRKMNK